MSRGSIFLVALLAGGCGSARPPVTVDTFAPDPRGFDLDRSELQRQGASESLLSKLSASRFRYFRMLAEPFELRTCDAFRGQSSDLPVMAIHGDPHVEQFVVTGETYGLEDFDHAGFGPITVDLVRFAASLHVACSDLSFPCSGPALVGRFLDAYRNAIDRPPEPVPEPKVVARLRHRAPRSTEPWLAWAETLMSPLPAEREASVRRSWSRFEILMRETHPEWVPTRVAVVRSGSLKMGFGSALERKLLFRVAGDTAAPGDDLIIEAREDTPPHDHGCVWRPTYGESLVPMFMALISRRLPPVFGFVDIPGSSRRFWVQSWDPGYMELELRDIQSQAELEEIALDAAAQLGGHTWTKFPENLRPYHRHTQLGTFDRTRATVERLAAAFADESIAAWARFGEGQSKTSPSDAPHPRLNH